MKNASLIILSLALAAAVAFGVISRKNLIETRKTLETEQISHRTAVRNLESTLRDRDRSTREISGEIDRMRTELNLAKASEATVKGRLEALEKQYRQQMGNLRDEISSLKIERDNVEGEVSALRSECESKVFKLTESLRQSTEEAHMLRESLARMTRQAEETEALTAAQTASMAVETARLREALESADALNEAIRIEMETLRAQCENRVGELNNEIELRNEDIARLEDALGEMERESALLEDRLLSLTGMWEARFARMKKEISRLSNADKAKRAAESLLEEERLKTSVLEENLRSVEKKLQSLADEVEAKEQERGSFESRMNEALETARKFREENVSLEKKLALVTAEAEANEKARSDLHAALEEARRQVSALEAKLESLADEVEAKEQARGSIESRMNEALETARKFREENVSLEKKLALVTAEAEANEKARSDLHAALEEERRDAAGRMESITSDLDKVRAENSHLGSQLVELKEDCEKQLEALESTTRAKDAEIAELNEKLQQARASLDGLQEKIMDASSTMESLRNETRALRKKANHKEQEVKAVRKTYESLVADLRRELDRREVRIQHIEEMISLEVVDSILFPPGRAAITPEGERLLRKVGDVLKGVENRKVRVLGHTDDIPIKAEYRKVYPTNWELSAARACAVVRFFQHRTGLSPSVLEPVGRSFYDPVADNATPEGRALNRRVTITVGPALKTR